MKNIYHKISKPLTFLITFIFSWLCAVSAYAFSLNALKDTFVKIGDKVADVVEGVADTVKKVISFFTDSCQVPPPPDAENINCVFCNLFDILYAAGARVANVSYQAFHSDFGHIVLIFTAVSMALIILKNVASMGAKDPGALLNDIVQRVFICTVIYIIVTKNYYPMFNLTIGAVINDGLQFVISSSGSIDASQYVAGAAADDFEVVMPPHIAGLINLSIRSIEAKINSLFDYGEWAWCLGFHDEKVWHVLPNPVYLIDAGLLYLAGVFFFVSYPWILADAILQLGISLALLPFAVTGYAFRGTRQYLSKVFSWILNSLFIFIFMFILIDCIISYAHVLLTGALTGTSESKILFGDPNQGIAFWGPNMIKLLFILWLGITYIPQIKELASKFAEGSSLSPGQQISTALINKMEQKTQEVGEDIAKKGWGAAVDTAASIRRGVELGGRFGMKKFVNRFGHIDADGNRAFTIGRGFMPDRFQMTFTNEKNIPGDIKDAQGNVIGNVGQKVRMMYDNNGNVIGRVDEGGNVIDDSGNNLGQINANGELLDASGNAIARADEERQAIFDQNGNIIGFVDADAKVHNLTGALIGQLDDNGEALDTDGHSLGSIYKRGEIAYDNNGHIMGTVDANKNVLDAHGNVVGIMDNNGDVHTASDVNLGNCDVLCDANGNAYAYVDANGRLRDFSGRLMGGRINSRGEIFNRNGTLIGHRGDQRQLALDENGKVIGIVDANGRVTSRIDGTTQTIDIGYIDANGKFVSNDVVGHTGGMHKLAYGPDGKPMGYIGADGTVYDLDGQVMDGATVDTKVTSVLKRSRKSLFLGRDKETISNQYVSIHKVYDKNGVLIRNEVEFNHDFATKHLVDESGRINVEALQVILNSALGKNPEYRQAIMEQLAVEMLKKRGKEVGRYFSGRKVTFDPNNPYKIIVEQVDHDGKTTSFSMNINTETGQVATGYMQDYTPTQIFSKTGREAGLFGVGALFNLAPFKHYTNSGVAVDTWLGTHHEMAYDPNTGEKVYIHAHKKYLFWGPTIETARYADRTVTHVVGGVDNTKRIAKIQKKLAKGKANGRGGMVRKSLFHVYESYQDANGQMAYEVRSRWSALNPKNYIRTGWRAATGTAKVLSKLPRAAFYTATLPLRPVFFTGRLILHPVKTGKAIGKNAKWTWNTIRHPQQTWRRTQQANTNAFINTWNGVTGHFAGAWQQFDSTVYTPTSTQTIHSYTDEILSGTYTDSLTIDRVDGTQQFMDLSTGETSSQGGGPTTHREFYFSNGTVEIRTTGDILSDGTTVDEVTKFKYSAAAQAGHDAVNSENQGNQVVEADGTIADNVKATRNGGEANPNDLLFGTDNIAGITSISGQNMGDFVLSLLATGRSRKSNKYKSTFLGLI